MAGDDEIEFIEEGQAVELRQPWNILLVDDEPDIHTVTRLALEGVEFRGRTLAFTSAYSGAEAEAALKKGPEFAVILLDVVMETDDAGLLLARKVREDYNNHRSRIILRTGEPGQAPERSVILNYEINDYKSKPELTVDRLYVSIVASLRAYDDIMAIERARRQLELNRQGLLKIIDASSTIFRADSILRLVQGALQQLQALVCPDQEALFAQVSGIAAEGAHPDARILAGTGRFANTTGLALREAVDNGLLDTLDRALNLQQSVIGENCFVALVRSENGHTNLLMVDGAVDLTAADASLVDLFCGQVGLAYDVIHRIAVD